jgi:hypothetical protein
MKRTIVLLVVFVMILMVTSPSFAVTTLYVGGSLDGSGTTRDTENNQPYSGDIVKDTVIDFTNISEMKKIKVDVDYEWGDFKYISGPPTFGLGDVQVGYPVINHDKGLVYVTLGEVYYNEYSNSFPKHKAASNMVGLDIVATPIERFQFEIALQHSIWDGSSKLYVSNTETTDYSCPELTVGKLKLQYIISDNFGFSVQYRVFDYKVKQLEEGATNLTTTVAGFIYRF